MTITPLSALTHDQIVEIARNAADNRVPLHDANVFEPGTPQHRTFSAAHAERWRELSAVEA